MSTLREDLLNKTQTLPLVGRTARGLGLSMAAKFWLISACRSENQLVHAGNATFRSSPQRGCFHPASLATTPRIQPAAGACLPLVAENPRRMQRLPVAWSA